MSIFVIIAAWLIVFPLLWIAICSLLMAVSGWNRLAERYPERSDRLLQSLQFQSGAIGPNPLASINFSACLTFDVGRKGLRIKVMRLFAPFSQPIFVEWSKLTVRQRKFLGFPYYDLMFGGADDGHMLISRRAGNRIARASGGALELPA